jgi:hypothetical protein
MSTTAETVHEDEVDPQERVEGAFIPIGEGPPDVGALRELDSWLYTADSVWTDVARWVKDAAAQDGRVHGQGEDRDAFEPQIVVAFPVDAAWEVTRLALNLKETAVRLTTYANTVLADVGHLSLVADDNAKQNKVSA